MTAFLFVAGAGSRLLLLPLLLALGTWCLQRARQRQRQLLGPREAVLAGRRVHTSVRAAAAVLAACCSAVALLQPAWGQGDGEPAAPEVVVCLDVSRSMAARDLLLFRGSRRRSDSSSANLSRRLPARGSGCGVRGEARLVVPLTTGWRGGRSVGRHLGARRRTRAAPRTRPWPSTRRRRRCSGCTRPAAASCSAMARTSRGRVSPRRRARKPRGCRCTVSGRGSEGGSKIVVELAGDATLPAGRGRRRRRHASRSPRARGDRRSRWWQRPHGQHGPHAAALARRRARAPRAVAAAVAGGSRAPAHRYQWFLFAALVFWMRPAAGVTTMKLRVGIALLGHGGHGPGPGSGCGRGLSRRPVRRRPDVAFSAEVVARGSAAPAELRADTPRWPGCCSAAARRRGGVGGAAVARAPGPSVARALASSAALARRAARRARHRRRGACRRGADGVGPRRARGGGGVDKPVSGRRAVAARSRCTSQRRSNT